MTDPNPKHLAEGSAADPAAEDIADAPAAPAAEPIIEDVPDTRLFFKVISLDGTEFRVTPEAINKCLSLAPLFKSRTPQLLKDIEKAEAILVGNYKPSILNIVFKWCEEHKNDAPIPTHFDDSPNPVENNSAPRYVFMSDFDEQLLEIDNQVLFDLILAADSLIVKGLVDVACKKVALMAEKKNPYECRRFFGSLAEPPKPFGESQNVEMN